MARSLIIVGLAGGSGSGKSSIARYISNHYGAKKCAIIALDSYYYDLKHLSMKEREKNNFDHPNAIDFKLMDKDLSSLISGEEIHVPIYDYKTHTRTDTYKEINLQDIIIIEGIFALFDKNIRSIMDIKIFVETNEKTRLDRRIKRDIKYRKRTYDSIISQYNEAVKPMYDNYVEPTKEFSDFIIEKGVKNTVAMEQLIAKITAMDKERKQ